MRNRLWMRLHRIFDRLEFGKFRGGDTVYSNREFWVLIEEPLPDNIHGECTRMVYGPMRGFKSVTRFVFDEKLNLRYRDVSRIADGVWSATAHFKEDIVSGEEKTIKVRLVAGLMTVLEHPLQEPLMPPGQSVEIFQGDCPVGEG